MNPLYLKILLFCLVPIGLFILFKGIKLLMNGFNGKVLLELPYNNRAGLFTISKAGTYSIWQKGPLFKKTPVAKFRPQIRNTANHQVIKLHYSILSPRVNGFSDGRMKLFTFKADTGNYELILGAGTSIFSFQDILAKAIPLADIDLEHYFIEVRESQSEFVNLLSILIILLGVGCTVAGFVLGSLADTLIL